LQACIVHPTARQTIGTANGGARRITPETRACAGLPPFRITASDDSLAAFLSRWLWSNRQSAKKDATFPGLTTPNCMASTFNTVAPKEIMRNLFMLVTLLTVACAGTPETTEADGKFPANSSEGSGADGADLQATTTFRCSLSSEVMWYQSENATDWSQEKDGLIENRGFQGTSLRLSVNSTKNVLFSKIMAGSVPSPSIKASIQLLDTAGRVLGSKTTKIRFGGYARAKFEDLPEKLMAIAGNPVGGAVSLNARDGLRLFYSPGRMMSIYSKDSNPEGFTHAFYDCK
jgi:hypothetical protein